MGFSVPSFVFVGVVRGKGGCVRFNALGAGLALDD